MPLPLVSTILFALAGFGLFAVTAELFGLWRLRRTRAAPPERYPAISILRPLCGIDDELQQNLESQLAIDYPAEWEILLGVHHEEDPAYPLARAFAAAHPERVRVVVQQGEPGHNPKVNQLLTLTREARHEVIVVCDANIRVPPDYLREHAAVLAQPRVGLAANLFAGVGEERLGAILDNQTICSFAAPNMAFAAVALHIDQIVGKSLSIPRKILEQMGGWHAVKDFLAEDQRLGNSLKEHGLRSAFCSTPVSNVQKTQRIGQFFRRHSRWAMIRFRVLLPAVLFEPLLNPTVIGLAGLLLAPWSLAAWFLEGSIVFAMMAATQWGALLTRGYGFRLWHLLLVPVRDVLFFACWLRGAMLRDVTWRGHPLRVLWKTRLAEPHALARARNMQRLSR